MALSPARNAAPSPPPAPPAEAADSSSPSAPKSGRPATEEIRAVAQKFAGQPVQNPEPGVWGVLTAISKNSRQRPQGMNMILTLNEHTIGRCVQDSKFQIVSIAISATHCRMYRDISSNQVYIKDCSTNGTYLNWTKLRKHLPAERLQHGDIISFVGPPHDDENSYAFVYREVSGATSLGNGNSILKRHREEFISESKRQKGIGIGSAEGPVSLDDVRSLQRSNSELRQQLESHVSTIETLKNENRASLTRHENEIKELKETISSPFLEQIKELKDLLDEKKKEFDSLNASKVVLESSIKDLNERLDASKQSYLDANEIIQSQKATISEREKQLEEERNLRREEREKASQDLKSAVEKIQLESQEEIKRQNNIFQKQQKEQQEVISKLQESEKENRVIVETLRSKLEDARESLVVSEKKVRKSESQFQEEQLVSTNHKKKAEALEAELKTLKAELENEKVAREEAWAKVSSLELEVASAIRELSIEKQRFQGARERIILRETQLRAFYSTTEEISSLFTKQQEQLKAMQRTLEDEENYENALDLNLNRSPAKDLTDQVHSKNTEASQKSNDDETQDLEFTSENRTKGFGSQFETERVVETENQVGETMQMDETETLNPKPLTETEQMDEEETLNPKPLTETEQMDEEEELTLNPKPLTETEQMDDETLNPTKSLTETEQMDEEELTLNPKSQTETEQIEEEKETEKNGTGTESGPVRTADLLASEALGSWAVGTESINNETNNNRVVGTESINNENNNDNNNDNDCNEINVSEIAAAAAAAADALIILEGQTSGSPNFLSKEKKEERKLSAMIEIVNPDFGREIDRKKVGYISDAETEESTDSDEGERNTDDDNHDGDQGERKTDHDNDDGDQGERKTDDDDDVMIEDSVG